MSIEDKLPHQWSQRGGEALPAVTQAQRERIYTEFDYLILPPKARREDTTKHLPENDTNDCTEPLCGTNGTEWVNHDIEEYPINHKRICKRCAKRFFDD